MTYMRTRQELDYKFQIYLGAYRRGESDAVMNTAILFDLNQQQAQGALEVASRISHELTDAEYAEAYPDGNPRQDLWATPQDCK